MHFKREEFACQCGCGWDAIDFELLEVLIDVRSYFNSPVLITSGNRCEKHNKEIGGAEKSQHTLGKAADFKVKHVSPVLVYNYLDTKYPDKYGLGIYENRVHLDVRNSRARWDKRKV